jgi:hypothetical protein
MLVVQVKIICHAIVANYLFILLNKNGNPYRSDEGMFCSEHCTEYSGEALGPLLGPSILLRRGKNVPPETFTRLGPPLYSAEQALTRRLYHHQHSLVIRQRDPQIDSAIGRVSARIKPNPRHHPVSPLKLVLASILQPTFGLLTEDSGWSPPTNSPRLVYAHAHAQAQARVRQGRERKRNFALPHQKS